jgi:hypothetical protein
MKAALAGTPPHDFPFPADEIAKVAGCGRGFEYFLKGTEPQYGCGNSLGENGAEYSQPAAQYVEPSFSPVATPSYIPPTDEPSPSAQPSAQPSVTSEP